MLKSYYSQSSKVFHSRQLCMTQIMLLRTTDLSEKKRLFIVHRVEPISGHKSSSEFFSYCVSWQAVHVHFDISANFFIWQELAWKNLFMSSLRRILVSFYPESTKTQAICHTVCPKLRFSFVNYTPTSNIHKKRMDSTSTDCLTECFGQI